MWSNTGGGGGGFLGKEQGNTFTDSPSQMNSPYGQVKKDRRTNSIVPVTIKTIEESEGDSIIISRTEVRMIVIVGIIQTVDVSSTKITYKVDDTTGVIEAVQWLQSDSEFDDESQKPLMELTYCRIIGTIKTQMSKKHAMILKIEPVTDINRITTHLLEVIHDAKKLEQIQLKQMNEDAPMSTLGMPSGGKMLGAVQDHGMPNISGGIDAGGQSSGLQGLKKVVYGFIQISNEEAGVSRDKIYASLGLNSSRHNLDEALEFLTNEGHIYSTIDDDHFKTTDGC